MLAHAVLLPSPRPQPPAFEVPEDRLFELKAQHEQEMASMSKELDIATRCVRVWVCVWVMSCSTIDSLEGRVTELTEALASAGAETPAAASSDVQQRNAELEEINKDLREQVALLEAMLKKLEDEKYGSQSSAQQQVADLESANATLREEVEATKTQLAQSPDRAEYERWGVEGV